jgi:hypothetical protein
VIHPHASHSVSGGLLFSLIVPSAFGFGYELEDAEIAKTTVNAIP